MNDLQSKIRARLTDDDLKDSIVARRAIARALAAEGVVLSPEEWARTVRDLVSDMITDHRIKPVGRLIKRAWETGKLRYCKEEPDLTQDEVYLEVATTPCSGIEFGYKPKTDTITFACRSIDGEDIGSDELVKRLAEAVGEYPPVRHYIVTQKTSVMAMSEEQAINHINNATGIQEVIAQEAELFEEEDA